MGPPLNLLQYGLQLVPAPFKLVALGYPMLELDGPKARVAYLGTHRSVLAPYHSLQHGSVQVLEQSCDFSDLRVGAAPSRALGSFRCSLLAILCIAGIVSVAILLR
jgi:hypothetical protein